MLGEGLLSLPCLFIGILGLQRHTLALRFPWVLIPVQQSRTPLSHLPALHFSNGYNHVTRQQYISYTSSSVVDTGVRSAFRLMKAAVNACAGSCHRSWVCSQVLKIAVQELENTPGCVLTHLGISSSCPL